MGNLHLVLLSFAISVSFINCAAILDDDVDQEGLYSKSDRVIILTKANFDRKIYGKKYAQVVQFYNSYCGHCRSFYPKYRQLAFEVVPWYQVFRLAVIDCFNEENNEICRDFEVMSYPSFRYLHENFVKGNGNVGERLLTTDTAEKLKRQIINKMQQEQQFGRFSMGPELSIASYVTYTDALSNVPRDVLFTFLIFEDGNSTIGSQIALDASGYEHVRVKRVNAHSELSELAGITHYPGLVAIGPDVAPKQITPLNPTQPNMLHALKEFLISHNYKLPADIINDDTPITEKPNNQLPPEYALKVYYSDLEKTLKSILHTEINHEPLSAESHKALLDFLEVVRDNFPYKGNTHLKKYLEELHANINLSPTWTPRNIDDLRDSLEQKYLPYKTKSSEYIGCRGSQPKYRGYTCGLWTLFHTLTVSAASKYTPEGPKVLRAMHGFVKHFFGCTDCVQHFLAMAERNRLFDVKDNDRAVLWLWVSHNEVNLRLAGDITEDPVHPKIQFPGVLQCPQCRMFSGAWKLPEVYQYLLAFYSSERIQDDQVEWSAAPALSQLSNLDLGMLSFLYILSFIIIILVIKFFLNKRSYRKRIYKYGWGKV